uniref:Uncharacterized protein n=1 Tax=Salix viminalis TaxID=40686 RepID=A0A6N2L4R9_SALVM
MGTRGQTLPFTQLFQFQAIYDHLPTSQKGRAAGAAAAGWKEREKESELRPRKKFHQRMVVYGLVSDRSETESREESGIEGDRNPK